MTGAIVSLTNVRRLLTPRLPAPSTCLAWTVDWPCPSPVTVPWKAPVAASRSAAIVASGAPAASVHPPGATAAGSGATRSASRAGPDRSQTTPGRAVLALDAPGVRERGHDRQPPATPVLAGGRRQPGRIKARSRVTHLDAHRLRSRAHDHLHGRARARTVADGVGDQLADQQLDVPQPRRADQMPRSIKRDKRPAPGRRRLRAVWKIDAHQRAATRRGP